VDISKADFGTTIKFGSLKDFLEKLNIENKCVADVVNTVDERGISLLEESIISRKFNVSNLLLENNAKINVVSNEGCNELHYLAANINCAGAVDLAYRLVEQGVDLNLKDKRNLNSAILSLCQEVLKKRKEEGIELIVTCLNKHPNFYEVNKYGYSLKQVIEERGTKNMKEAMEVIN